jgi:hypothetical protein
MSVPKYRVLGNPYSIMSDTGDSSSSGYPLGCEQHIISLVTRVHGSGVTIYRYMVLLGLNYKYSI